MYVFAIQITSDDDEDEQEGMLPAMKVNEKLQNNYITATERYSRAAARYTEASLVKKLEELGIGRPSTYAPTISTIINRNYVEKGNLEGQERGSLTAHDVATMFHRPLLLVMFMHAGHQAPAGHFGWRG